MSIEIALAIVLVSVLVTNGIVTLTAIQSSWHWFLRTGIVLACLSPLLLIPALEPFVTLVLQSATIAAGVTVFRLRRSWRERKENSQAHSWKDDIRFSLSTVLLIAGLAGILLAVGTRMPELNEEAWLSLFVIGTCSGACVLLAWAISESSAPWYVRWPLMLVGAAVFAAPLVWFDAFAASVVNGTGWPPVAELQMFVAQFGFSQRYLLWWFVSPLTGVSVGAWLWASTLKRGTRERTGTAHRWASLVTVGGLRLAVVGVGVPAVVVLWKLLTPLPIPEQKLPPSNSYATVNGLGRAVNESPFGRIEDNWSEVNEKRLEPALSAIQRELQELSRTLPLSYHVPLDYTFNDFLMLDDIANNHRTLGRALAAQARLAILQGRPDEGCRYFVATVRFGYVVRSGGLVINAMVGTSISGIGVGGLYENRRQFSQQACVEAGRELLSMPDGSEPIEVTLQRERIWNQHAFGWHGHLVQILSEVAGHRPPPLLAYERTMLEDYAMTRLIALELALQAYHADEGHWPVDLADLVPAYLPYVPRDPFDGSGEPLRYAERQDGYVLYSVGENATDEGGLETRTWESEGDLTLERYSIIKINASPQTSTTGSVRE